MSPLSFASYIRRQTKTNSTTFTDAAILELANTFKDEISAQIADLVGDTYFMLEWYADLAVGEREYPLPTQILNSIKHVYAKLDGTNRTHLHQVDNSQVHFALEDTEIQENWAGKDPAFTLMLPSLFILSSDDIIAVTEGLELWSIVFPANITDLTSTIDMSEHPDTRSHGFPRQFHELLARRVIIARKEGKDKPLPLTEREQKYDADLYTQIMALRGTDLHSSFQGSMPYEDGSNL
jgi:hypothetical protein